MGGNARQLRQFRSSDSSLQYAVGAAAATVHPWLEELEGQFVSGVDLHGSMGRAGRGGFIGDVADDSAAAGHFQGSVASGVGAPATLAQRWPPGINAGAGVLHTPTFKAPPPPPPPLQFRTKPWVQTADRRSTLYVFFFFWW